MYYARAVDCTMLVALSAIATHQTTSTENTINAVVQLLNYAASHPNAVVRYRASDMYLWVHSDGSYLSETKARSRCSGYFLLGDRLPVPSPTSETQVHSSTCPNGAVLVNTHVMNEVVALAAECEFGCLFYNGKDAVVVRTSLKELGHEQGPTPMQTDNSTASGIANDDVKVLLPSYQHTIEITC